MANTLAERVNVTLKEKLIPKLQTNFWRMQNFPMLRMLGKENKMFDNGNKTGSSLSRVSSIDKIDMHNNFEITHQNTSFGGGVYGMAEDATLNVGEYNAVRSQVNVKTLGSSFKVTLQNLKGTSKANLAQVKDIVQNAYGAYDRTARTMNQQLVGQSFAEGGSVLATVNGAVSSDTTIVVDNGGTEETPATRHLEAGDSVLIGTPAEVAAGTAVSATVASVTDDVTFETTAAVTVVDNDIVVKAGVYDSGNSVYTEMTGLDRIISSSDIQGITRASAGWSVPYLDASVGTLTVNKILKAIFHVRRYSGNSANLAILCNSITWLRYSSLLVDNKRYDAESFSGNLVGGTSGLVLYAPEGGLPVMIDDYVPDGTMYIVDPDALTYGELMPFDFVPDGVTTDGYTGQRLAGKLTYEYAFAVMGNLGATNPRAFAKLSGITGPSV